MNYTIEVYKKDGRCKKGEKLKEKVDMMDVDTLEEVEAIASKMYPASKGYRIEIHETMVERFNLMSRKLYMERYDTPICCSPASETYWSM